MGFFDRHQTHRLHEKFNFLAVMGISFYPKVRKHIWKWEHSFISNSFPPHHSPRSGLS